MPRTTASPSAPSARRRARARNAATDASADARNEIVAVEFAPDGGRERVWLAETRGEPAERAPAWGDWRAIHRLDLRPDTRAKGGFAGWRVFGATQKNLARAVKRAFLPGGFPASVSPDYLAFQSWDTAQGLCSYVRGALTTQALLEGVGIGDAEAVAVATAASATAQFVLRDVVGSLGAVLFAASRGGSFDAYAKQWRFFADCANNLGMLLELLAPTIGAIYGQTAFFLVACLGSLARALCGVAGGASRVALTRHFARAHNAADVAAKEGSQETAASVIGSLIGVWVARATDASHVARWVTFLALTAAHVFCNARALRCLGVDAVNRHRALSMLDTFFHKGEVPTPIEYAKTEPLLFFTKSVKDDGIALGASLASVDAETATLVLKRLQVVERFNAFKGEKDDASYLVCLAGPSVPAQDFSQKKRVKSSRDSNRLAVLLRRGSSPNDALRGYFAAAATRSGKINKDERALTFDVDAFVAHLRARGWDVDARVALNPGGYRLVWGDDARHAEAWDSQGE
jgi:hypothetical protein